MAILAIAYIVLGYWACGRTIYANKIRFGTATNLFISRLIIGMMFGWILIPIALVLAIVRHFLNR